MRNVADPFDMVLARGKEGETLSKLWANHRSQFACYSDAQHPFRLQGSADLNSYKMFTEVFWKLLQVGGRLGVILPTGIYSDFGTKDLREEFFERGGIELIYAFQNEKRVFAAAHHAFKQVALVACRGVRTISFLLASAWESATRHTLMRFLTTFFGMSSDAMVFTTEDVRSYSPKHLAS